MSNSPLIITWGGRRPQAELNEYLRTQVGNKAANLYDLFRWGFPVPPGFVISRLVDDYTLSNHALALRTHALTRGFDKDLMAVRSSPHVSMPGMLMTQLNVPLMEMNTEFPMRALKRAVKGVLLSWLSPKAIQYRETMNLAHYPPKMGCIVQCMVNPFFGGCSGIMFTHNPITKCRRTMGELIPSKLGTDLVEGKVKPAKLRWLREHHPKAYKRLLVYGTKLVKLTGKPQDVEFVVTSKSELYLVQTRDMKFSTGPVQTEVARDAKGDRVIKGQPGCQGLVEGTVVTCETDMAVLPKPHILYRDMTTTDDFGLMVMADAFVTSLGGPTCHAAIVARSMNKPCVVGTQTPLFTGTIVCVDGKAGTVHLRRKK